jgi:polyhydroxyalkanoate synthesis regulator phasin
MKVGILDLALIMGLVFVVGYTSNIFIANAQNSTTNANAPIVQSIDNLIYVVIIPIVLSILSIVKGLVDKGYLDKKVGSALVMGADAAHAIGDTRETVNKVAQTSYEMGKLASPQAAKYADEVAAPMLNEVGKRVSEYKPKIDDFAAIANSETKKRTMTTDEIQNIKSTIPDEIVPS